MNTVILFFLKKGCTMFLSLRHVSSINFLNLKISDFRTKYHSSGLSGNNVRELLYVPNRLMQFSNFEASQSSNSKYIYVTHA